MKTLLILSVLLYPCTHYAEGLTCLKCDSVPQPRLCNKVMECFDGESCSVQKILNQYGEHFYKLGCLSNKVCSSFTNTSQSSAISCSECCNTGDLCNSNGCGEPGYPEERGPVCYNCPLHTDKGQCHDIEFCFIGEVCNIVGKNVFSSLVYTSKCISKHECKQTEETHVAIIGKRDLDTHQQHTCDACCVTDICNKNCTTARLNTDPCTSNPCHHGNCISKGDNIECICSPGYSGQFCENDLDECSSQPCLHGFCTDQINGYICSCYAGYSDLNCQTDINECSSVPCLHGSCTDQANGYNCTCFAGYSGLNCQTDIDECSSQPCLHGSCTDQLNGYNCTCFAGYSGKNCQTDVDDCASSNCGNGTCVDGIGNYTCACSSGFTGTNCERMLTDCYDLYHYDGKRTDGVYTVVTWKTHQHIAVYCDMTTYGGGWTVFQYRFDGSMDFYRNFSEYEQGFGNLSSEFWLGLSYIQEIASQGLTDLRIDLEAANGTRGFEKFQRFYLSPAPYYTLNVGRTLDSLRISSTSSFIPYHNGSTFSTYDHDISGNDCARRFHGAWWYDNCYFANLNGKYVRPGTLNNFEAIMYRSFLYDRSLKSSKMMMKRE